MTQRPTACAADGRRLPPLRMAAARTPPTPGWGTAARTRPARRHPHHAADDAAAQPSTRPSGPSASDRRPRGTSALESDAAPHEVLGADQVPDVARGDAEDLGHIGYRQPTLVQLSQRHVRKIARRGTRSALRHAHTRASVHTVNSCHIDIICHCPNVGARMSSLPARVSLTAALAAGTVASSAVPAIAVEGTAALDTRGLSRHAPAAPVSASVRVPTAPVSMTYQVQVGDSVWLIAQRTGTSVRRSWRPTPGPRRADPRGADADDPEPGGGPPPRLSPPPPHRRPRPPPNTVVRGDTLSHIAASTAPPSPPS
jgi:LysM repeat protein